MTKYTSAPWTVNHDDGAIGILGNNGSNARGQKYIVSVLYDEEEQKEYLPNSASHEEARANAKLIAGAPDMLAALKEALCSLDYAAMALQVPESCQFRDTIAQVRAAINQATGE